MNQYNELFNRGIIEFNKLLIDRYYLIGLDEVEVIILIKLNELLKQNKRLLSVNEISHEMSVGEKICSEKLVDLVHRGYIGLELSDVNSREEFNLNGTYQRILDSLNAKSPGKDENNNKIKRLVRLLENEMGKSFSPLELEMIARWVTEFNYEEHVIEEAILKSLKNKKTSVAYIDRLLLNSKIKLEESQIDESIQDLFNKVYAKSG